MRKMRWHGRLIGFLAGSVVSWIVVPAPMTYADVNQAIEALRRKDDAAAFHEFTILAENGDALAQYYLGLCYEAGWGTPPDPVLSAKWWRAAAEQGLKDAQTNLGLKYYEGVGVPIDFAEAARWLQSAADQGDPVAQTTLAVLYSRGHGVPEDQSVAVRLFAAAAEQGNANAQYGLGRRYMLGLGIQQDLVQAYVWLSLAAEAYEYGPDRDDAVEARDSVASKMTEEQILVAQHMAAEWRTHHPIQQ